MRIPTYRLHKSSGQALVVLNGQFIYLGKHGTPESRAAYERKVAEFLGSGRRVVPHGGRITVAELFDQYRQAKMTDVRDQRAAKIYLPIYGELPVTDFGPLALRAVRDIMVRAKWNRAEINRVVGRVKKMFRWGVAEEIVPADTRARLDSLAGLRLGKTTAPEPTPIKPVDEAVVRKTLPKLSTPLRAAVELQWLTAMRAGEVLAMRPMDIDRAGEIWTYKPPQHKTAWRGHDKSIAIGPRAQAILLPWLDRPPQRYCFCPYEAGNHGTERYTTATYGQAIIRACKAAKVKPWHSHQLRHAAATLLRAEFGIDAAQAVLGHRHLSTTEIYAEKSSKLAEEAMRKAG